MPTEQPKIEVILFDLGGVLVELHKPTGVASWFDENLSEGENWLRWLTSPFTQAFERGEISPQVFAASFIEENKLDIDSNEFLSQFQRWVVGFYPGVFSMLANLSKHYTLGVFSNITAVHWPGLYQQLSAHGSISHYFASYQMGLAKPDPEAFVYVAKQIGADPGQILFLDDNQINTAGAQSVGFKAEVVKGFNRLEPVLSRYKVITTDQD